MSINWVVGIDEVGRGPLAGPVAVGIVLMPVDFDWSLLPDVGDSKKVSEKNRERIYAMAMKLAKSGALWCTVEMGTARAIDKRGIAVVIRECIDKGLRDCSSRSFLELQSTKSGSTYSSTRQDLVLDWGEVAVKLDGSLKAPEYCVHQETIIKGDAKEKVIGLASILAKVTRDTYMNRLATKAAYIPYEFARHKGYGTARHRTSIASHGLSPEHRRTFCRNIKDVV